MKLGSDLGLTTLVAWGTKFLDFSELYLFYKMEMILPASWVILNYCHPPTTTFLFSKLFLAGGTGMDVDHVQKQKSDTVAVLNGLTSTLYKT